MPVLCELCVKKDLPQRIYVDLVVKKIDTVLQRYDDTPKILCASFASFALKNFKRRVSRVSQVFFRHYPTCSGNP